MSEASPLLPSSRRTTSFGSRRRSSGTRRRLSNAEVHPDPSTVEPLLPASAPHPTQDTRLHRTKWWAKAGEPNSWARLRHIWREELAEFWGTFIILLFGTGVECQVGLHAGAFGNYLQARFAWAAGVALAVWLSGGISGGHCNPSVTLALALFRGFPVRKVPSFILAQIAGATAASLVIYANYYYSIAAYPASVEPFFFTFPSRLLPARAAFGSEFLASATLLAIVFALGDKANLSPPKGTQPVAMFLALLAIGSSLGANTGYAINGARDTGPRIALWLVGYGSKVFTHDRFYFVWAPWVGSMAGAATGAALYDAFLYTGRDSPFNRPSRASLRAQEVFDEEEEEEEEEEQALG